jgi:hypothetical protein
MKVFIIPLIVLFLPSIILFLILFKNESEVIKNKWIVIVFGFFAMLFNLFLIVVSFQISAAGTYERGIRCQVGSTAFIPIGFVFSFIIIPLITLIKVLKFKAPNK